MVSTAAGHSTGHKMVLLMNVLKISVAWESMEIKSYYFLPQNNWNRKINKPKGMKELKINEYHFGFKP